MKAQKYTRETIRDLGIKDRNFPSFNVGDTVAISQRIKEWDEKKKEYKERIQVFEGDVICKHKNGIASTFTVRKIGANAVAVERIFPYYSPLIDSIAFVRKGKVRRAKLYYMRKRVGKAARVEELVMSKQDRDKKEASAE